MQLCVPTSERLYKKPLLTGILNITQYRIIRNTRNNRRSCAGMDGANRRAVKVTNVTFFVTTKGRMNVTGFGRWGGVNFCPLERPTRPNKNSEKIIIINHDWSIS